VLNWSGGYDQLSAATVTTESGPGGLYNLVTYNFATEAANIQAYQESNPIYYFNMGFVVAGDAGTTFSVDAINAVPEPSTWALMLGGLASLVFFRRFNRKNA